jgi:glutamine amidotransferase
MAEVEKRNTVLAEADYLGLPIASAITYENISGVQFHPERSGKDGLAILKNFSET